MDRMIDFTNDPRVFKSLGGTDMKFTVNHSGTDYILKFPDEAVPRTEMTTSHTNNVTSEYVSSHIAATAGLPVHDTVLGFYGGEVVVGCMDFRAPGEENIEFREFASAVFRPSEIKRVIRLDQIYTTLDDKRAFSESLREESIKRYWDTFVVDALVGNFDRHAGNWGYISDGRHIRHAPAYDFGSSLLPKLSDEGIAEIAGDDFRMMERCLVFPSPALYILQEKAGKPGYYDLMASGYDRNCTEAVERMVPRIDMDRVHRAIEDTPFISGMRKSFYSRYLDMRKELVLDRAYERCVSRDFDRDAMERILKGRQYSSRDLAHDISCGKFGQPARLEDMLAQARHELAQEADAQKGDGCLLRREQGDGAR